MLDIKLGFAVIRIDTVDFLLNVGQLGIGINSIEINQGLERKYFDVEFAHSPALWVSTRKTRSEPSRF